MSYVKTLSPPEETYKASEPASSRQDSIKEYLMILYEISHILRARLKMFRKTDK
ncbi:MAG: hypothetical protein GX111_07625 [Clostridiales bacterium]|nr:hypothetical protein [Clostridiales bacterium]